MARCSTQKVTETAKSHGVARPGSSCMPRSSKEEANRLSVDAIMDQDPVLSAAEEKELVSQKGTSQWPQAKEQLMLHNLRLVASIARKYNWMDEYSFDDIVSHGVIGLMLAIDRFDPREGTKLATYATYWILQEIRDNLLYKRGPVKRPAYLEKMAAKLKRCCSELAQDGDSSPSDQLLSQRTGIPERKVREIMDIYGKNAISMNADIGGGGDTQVGDMIPSNVNVEDEAVRKITLMDIAEAVKKLKPIEQQVIMMRFGFVGGSPMTLEQCAEETGYSIEGCRQVQETAIRKLQADYRETKKH